jgi:hypothetical protein
MTLREELFDGTASTAAWIVRYEPDPSEATVGFEELVVVVVVLDVDVEVVAFVVDVEVVVFVVDVVDVVFVVDEGVVVVVVPPVVVPFTVKLVGTGFADPNAPLNPNETVPPAATAPL